MLEECRNARRKIILASQSPRRRELLTQAGFLYTVEPSQIEERITEHQPDKVVMELAEQKAEDIYWRHMAKTQDASETPGSRNTPILVIGADTIVAYQNRILGKPHSETEAFEMLELLQGNTHQVYTGVALVWNEADSKQKHVFYEKTEVICYPMTEQEISDYIRTGDCMDKAGAYGIQTQFGVYIRELHGDYNNVVGLPIARLYQEMKKIKG